MSLDLRTMRAMLTSISLLLEMSFPQESHMKTFRSDRTYAAVGLLVRVCMLFAVLLVAGCGAAGPQIRSNAAPGVDFGAFKTFSFYAELGTDRAGYNSLVSQQLMFSARREMELRGFRFVADPAEADLLINFHAHLSEQIRVRSTPDPWINQSYWNHRRGFYQPWPGHRSWPSHSTVEVDQVTEGRVSVDVVQASRQMLVWEGIASQRVTQRTLRDVGPALDGAIYQIFQSFPMTPRAP
jgi:hypothetical protein